MKKAVAILLAIVAFSASAAFANEVLVFNGTLPDPKHSIGTRDFPSFTKAMATGYRLVSVVYAEGQFYFYLSK